MEQYALAIIHFCEEDEKDLLIDFILDAFYETIDPKYAQEYVEYAQCN